MHNEFKKGSMVFVCGYGENNGKFYWKKSAIVLEVDPYFKDYHVRFRDGTEDWVLPKYLRKPYVYKERKKEDEN